MLGDGFHIIIPARWGSERLPGKVLADIAGQSMLERVYRCALAAGAQSVHIATADQCIIDAAEALGASVLLTADEHTSGTERVAEAADALGLAPDDTVINLQCDEPLMDPRCIAQLGNHVCQHGHIKAATLSVPITDLRVLLDTNVVKVVTNKRGNAMYFSRAPIPWDHKTPCGTQEITLSKEHKQHVGLYAFRRAFLEEYNTWAGCALAEMESLEQLRLLWHAGRMCVLNTPHHGPLRSVDTQADLDWVRAYLTSQPVPHPFDA